MFSDKNLIYLNFLRSNKCFCRLVLTENFKTIYSQHTYSMVILYRKLVLTAAHWSSSVQKVITLDNAIETGVKRFRQIFKRYIKIFQAPLLVIAPRNLALVLKMFYYTILKLNLGLKYTLKFKINIVNPKNT